MALQRQAGNRVAVAHAAQIQAKLMVGSAYDPAEREADEVARQVMSQISGRSAEVVDVGEEAPALGRAVHTHTAACADAPIGMDGGEVSSQLAEIGRASCRERV